MIAVDAGFRPRRQGALHFLQLTNVCDGAMKLIYIADPMCSWCAGLGHPRLSGAGAEHGGELHLVAQGYLPIEGLRERLTASRPR